MVTISQKKAIILLSGEDEHARALHALLYTLDLKEHGFQPKLLFDGAGVTWLGKFSESGNGLRQIFDRAQSQGLIDTACNSCAHAFKSTEAAETLGVKLSQEGSHISVGALARDGHEVIVV